MPPPPLPKDASLERKAYEEAFTGVQFTRDPNSALEAVMRDPMATNGERFIAWLKRSAWGNYRLHAVRADGEDATQADCATELGIDKTRLSHVVAYHEKRGYLRREGKRLIPVIAPQLGPQPAKPGGPPSTEFSQFLETWKASHATEYAELEAARATLKRIRKVALDDFKKLRAPATNAALKVARSRNEKLRAPATNAAPISIERVREVSEESPGRSVVPPSLSSAPLQTASVSSAEPTDRPITNPANEKINTWLRASFPHINFPIEAEKLECIGATIRNESNWEQFKAAALKNGQKARGWKYFVRVAESCVPNQATYQQRPMAATAGGVYTPPGPRPATAEEIAEYNREQIAKGKKPWQPR